MSDKTSPYKSALPASFSIISGNITNHKKIKHKNGGMYLQIQLRYKICELPHFDENQWETFEHSFNIRYLPMLGSLITYEFLAAKMGVVTPPQTWKLYWTGNVRVPCLTNKQVFQEYCNTFNITTKSDRKRIKGIFRKAYRKVIDRQPGIVLQDQKDQSALHELQLKIFEDDYFTFDVYKEFQHPRSNEDEYNTTVRDNLRLMMHGTFNNILTSHIRYLEQSDRVIEITKVTEFKQLNDLLTKLHSDPVGVVFNETFQVDVRLYSELYHANTALLKRTTPFNKRKPITSPSNFLLISRPKLENTIKAQAYYRQHIITNPGTFFNLDPTVDHTCLDTLVEHKIVASVDEDKTIYMRVDIGTLIVEYFEDRIRSLKTDEEKKGGLFYVPIGPLICNSDNNIIPEAVKHFELESKKATIKYIVVIPKKEYLEEAKKFFNQPVCFNKLSGVLDGEYIKKKLVFLPFEEGYPSVELLMCLLHQVLSLPVILIFWKSEEYNMRLIAQCIVTLFTFIEPVQIRLVFSTSPNIKDEYKHNILRYVQEASEPKTRSNTITTPVEIVD